MKYFVTDDQREGTAYHELYEEADAWAKDVLKEHGCFTILGL